MLLTGTNCKPKTAKEARALIGKKVIYLMRSDIDSSGRGYFFPRHGTVVEVSGKNIAIDFKSNFVIHLSSLAEMVLADES